MELIGQRLFVGVSDEVRMEFPSTADGINALNAKGSGVGVWQDGIWYVWGDSCSDDAPENITWVMTAQEYRRYREGGETLKPQDAIKMMQRAEKMYPDKSVFGKITEESRRAAAAAIGLPYMAWPDDEAQQAMKDLVIEPGVVNIVSVLHDDGCPTLKSQNDADCTCDTTGINVSQL